MLIDIEKRKREVRIASNIALVLAILSIVMLVFCGCNTTKPNYKVTEYGLVEYARTNGDITKDILSNGDTLITSIDTIYIVKVSK